MSENKKGENIIEMGIRGGSPPPQKPDPKNVRRKNLSISCEEDEFESMKLIRNRIICAQQVLSPRMVPQDGSVDEEQVRLFVKGAVDAKAEAMFLEQDWWKSMTKKYDLPNNTYLDLGTGQFYTLIDMTPPSEEPAPDVE